MTQEGVFLGFSCAGILMRQKICLGDVITY